MKKLVIKNSIFLVILVLLTSTISNAQTGLNFQGVARSSNNVIIASQQISLRLSILQGSATGSVEYSETRKVTTNAQGLFAVVIGDADATSTMGSFNTINWKNTPKYLKIEMDANAGNNYTTIGTTQFQYVAYAQFANSVDAENIVGVVPVARGGTGATNLTSFKSSLVLDKINNTSDADKPISTKTQTALDLKLNAADTSKYTKQSYTDAALLTKFNLADTGKYTKQVYIDSSLITKLKLTDTASMLSNRIGKDTLNLSGRINAKANTSDVNTFLALKANTSDVTTSLSSKVDKVTGKELSTNDYSNAEKAKLAAITGTNTGDQDLSSYATNTALALKANISDVNTSLGLKANASDVTTSLSSKVDKVTGKELSTNDYSNAEKAKLAAITGTNTGDQDLSSYATITALALKANTADVNTSLSLKANASDVTTSLALKENTSNKSSAADLGGLSPSDVLFPTQKAVKDYVTANASSGGVTDGGITTIKLADGAVTDTKLATGISKSKVGLGNVENVSISTWAGTNSLTTVGTITSGTWSGTAISLNNGGTGATNATAARVNLGLVIGANVQAPLVAGKDYQIPLIAGTNYIVPNSSIAGATKTKITYDTKGLITAGADATTADIEPSTNRKYVTDVQAGVISNTSGVNTGDETTSSIKSKLGITTLSGSNTGDQTNVTGNAGTATKLATARNINDVPFDGTSNIIITADAGTLSGTILNSTVTGSSLTSVGTLANLTVTNPIAGSITGNAATAGNITATSNTTLTSVSNLNTVGTITSGVWSGTTVAVEKGGTGLTSAGTAGQVLTSTGSGTLTWTTTNKLLSIGDVYQGGKVAYILQAGDPGYDATIQKGIIAASSDQSTGISISWYNSNNTTTGATGTAIGTGLSNTNTIITSQGAITTSYAAGLARAYKGGGYTDWYLPSKDELNKLYLNRTAIGGFSYLYYWSSTEGDNFTAWIQNFNSGDQLSAFKSSTVYVRAIRAFSAVKSIEDGGTGASTASAARTNLGLEIGTNVQAPLVAGTGVNIDNMNTISTIQDISITSNPKLRSLSLTNGDNTFLANNFNQIIFGWNRNTGQNNDGTIEYAHAIKTRHNSLSSLGNNIDFFTWDPDNNYSSTAIGNKHIMTIQGDGKVGIGTLYPLYSLDVVGDIKTTRNLIAGTVTYPNVHNSTAGQLLSIDGSGTATWATLDAGTLSGTTLKSTITGSSLTTVGTITSGVWSATTVAVNKGGTGLTSTGTKGQVLTSTGSGTLTWTTPVFLPTIVIGTQQWMRENLDVMTYRNGDVIPQVTDATAWAGLTTGAWCYYNNDPLNGAIYGKLYNWYAVNDPRGLAPQGWHIPTDAEWTTLGTLLGVTDGLGYNWVDAGGKMKTPGITRWTTPNTSATNESGFTGLPGGYRYAHGPFNKVSELGYWWSATETSADRASVRNISYNNSTLWNFFLEKKYGYSVRCLRD